MSDPRIPGPPTPLPPASVDITGYRRTVEQASRAPSVVTPGRVGWLIVVVVIVLTATTAALLFQVDRAILAGSVIAAVLVLVFLVMLPARRAAAERRRSLSVARAALNGSVDALVGRLASIGYAIPRETATDWLSSPTPTAGVPLVHDSAIAARWWRPAEGDDRVFVEAILRQNDEDAALPVLPPLQSGGATPDH